MLDTVKLPEIPDFESIITDMVESTIKDRIEDWAERQVLAMAKSIAGPAAIVDNIQLEMGTKKAKTELPTIIVVAEVEKIVFHKPEIRMETKTVAKLHIPEVYMKRVRLGFNHKHCKNEWKVKHVGLGIKMKVPVVTCWETPAYADEPRTRMNLQEWKTDVPIVTMKTQEVSIEIPRFKTGTTSVELDLPQVEKITFDLAGTVHDIVPGGSFLKEMLKIIEEVDEFRVEIESKIERAIDKYLRPVTQEIDRIADIARSAIDDIQDRYSEMIKELEEKSGEHSEEIQKLNEELEHLVEPIKKQLKPFERAIEKLEKCKERALNLVRSIKLV